MQRKKIFKTEPTPHGAPARCTEGHTPGGAIMNTSYHGVIPCGRGPGGSSVLGGLRHATSSPLTTSAAGRLRDWSRLVETRAQSPPSVSSVGTYTSSLTRPYRHIHEPT